MTVRELVLALLKERASNETYQHVNRIMMNDNTEGLSSSVMVEGSLIEVAAISNEDANITWLKKDNDIPF